MPQEQRKEIIEALACVDRVVFTEHEPDCLDMSVCSELRKYQPNIFANGGDRVNENTPEVACCQELGIAMVFNVGQAVGAVQFVAYGR